MDRLKAYMKEKGAVVDKALDRFLPRLKEEPATLHEAMRYSIFAGGKRLRPLLCLMGAEVFGAPVEDCMGAACALEMVHTYSLIHDDLPAMDNDDYRRGKLSCHKAFGEAIAILAGDALLTLAFGTLALHASKAHTTELAQLLAAAAGHAGMVGGQVLDLESEDGARTPAAPKKVKLKGHSDIMEELPSERVEKIHRRKTGAIIAAAVTMGAVIGGADSDAYAPLLRYGKKVGLAFQIKDDILDIEQPSEKLGKSAGKDETAGKLTYPGVMGMVEAKALLRDTIIDAKKALKEFGERTLMLRLLADFIAEREH